MNERIKQLLNQATTDALYETKDAVDFLDNPVSKQQRELQLEKFAELIVKEMLRTCEDHPAWTGRMIGEEIKETFRS
jgi:hypothetical protein